MSLQVRLGRALRRVDITVRPRIALLVVFLLNCVAVVALPRLALAAVVLLVGVAVASAAAARAEAVLEQKRSAERR